MDPLAQRLGSASTVELDRGKFNSRRLDRLVFAEDFVNATCCAKVEGKNLLQGIYNYFQSSDPKEWRTNVQGYREVMYHNIWPGIDLRIFGNGRDLEQEFIIQPGGYLNRVEISYRGIENLGLSSDGSLEVNTAFGKLRETKPRIYQEIAGKRIAVDGRYRLTGERSYTFMIGARDARYRLVIDPTLLYSTFLGGSAGNNLYTRNSEVATGIAVDASGDAYVTGFTASTDFPTTPGAFQTSFGYTSSSQNVFISKLNATGSALVYSTYLSASYASSIAVDVNGNAYITGWGAGSTFPTTPNAFWPTNPQQSCTTPFDFYLVALNSSGNQLVYSTCFNIDSNTVGGVSFGYFPQALAVDSNGRAYVAGGANGSIPTTSNAYQSYYANMPASAFVTVFDTTASGASSLFYSTYLSVPPALNVPSPSGTGYAYPNANAGAIAVDSFGKVYVAGTAPIGFPTTPGAFQATHASSACGGGTCYVSGNVFVAKLDPTASATASLIYSTFLGGAASSTTANGIAVDGAGNAYITGSVTGALPITSGAFQTTSPFAAYGASGSAFVTKLNAAGSNLVYSTYLGGNSPSSGNGIALDSLNDAYVAGNFRAGGASVFFPTTADAFQSSFTKASGDFSDAFLTKLRPDGSALTYSSYFGGIGDDVATAVAVDQTGDAYIAGHTSSVNLPVTLGAFQQAMDGSGDTFIAKFPVGAVQTLSISSVFPVSGGNAGTVTPHIIGGGFHAGATVELVGATTVLGVPTIGSEGRTIDVSFNLSTAPIGQYSLTVINPDGNSVTLPNVFTIQQGGNPQLSVSVVGRHAVATGHGPISFTVQVQNAGNVDAIGVVLSLYGIPSGAILTPLFTVSQPPVGPNGASIDFSQTPFAPIVGQEQIPTLLLPNVPVGTSVVFPFTLAINSLPPLPPLQPMPPGNPVPLPPGPVINITALLTEIDAFCSGNCLTDILGLVPGVSCLSDLICGYLRTALLTVPQYRNGQSVFSLGQVLVQLAADCGLLGNIGKAVSDAAGEINLLLHCIQTLINGSANLSVEAAVDPNEKDGQLGLTSLHWTNGANALSYIISFLNQPGASAAADNIIITDILDPFVDLSTLKVTSITLGGTNIPLSQVLAPGLAQNQASSFIDFRPAQSLLVNVNLSLDPSSRTLTLQFASIDPTTGVAPINSNVGALPPGAEGTIAYSIKPASMVITGASVANQATVGFDSNPLMKTQVWVNTIDNSPPVSQVSALPSSSTCPAFRVSWSGSDVGSGLQGFTIYVSDTGGPFTAWLLNTTAASSDYQGVVGHTYGFYSIATDLVGNVEAAKSGAEASTTVTGAGPCGPPSLSAQIGNVSQSGTKVTATLTLTNTGFTAAATVNVNQMTFRTLSGSGTVTLASPTLPAAEEPLAIGASMTVPLTLNVPATVIRFSVTEGGNLQDSSGNTYNYSLAQMVIP